MEVEYRSDTAGDDIGQLARHGVFVDIGETLEDALVQLACHRLLHGVGQPGEAR